MDIPILARPDKRRELLDGLSELVEDGELTFPNEVLAEVRSYCADADYAAWARAVSLGRRRSDVPYECVLQIVSKCKDLVDYEAYADEEPAAVYVAAMAHQALTASISVIVVTDEIAELPDRLPLGLACDELGFTRFTLRKFLETASLEHLIT